MVENEDIAACHQRSRDKNKIEDKRKGRVHKPKREVEPGSYLVEVHTEGPTLWRIGEESSWGPQSPPVAAYQIGSFRPS